MLVVRRQFSTNLLHFCMSCEQRHWVASVLNYFFPGCTAIEDKAGVSLQTKVRHVYCPI